jgi:hypothetical protein
MTYRRTFVQFLQIGYRPSGQCFMVSVANAPRLLENSILPLKQPKFWGMQNVQKIKKAVCRAS